MQSRQGKLNAKYIFISKSSESELQSLIIVYRGANFMFAFLYWVVQKKMNYQNCLVLRRNCQMNLEVTH